MNFVEEAKEYDSFSDRMGVFISELKQIIVESNEPLEGNCFYYHSTLSLCEEQYAKQVNLFTFGKVAETKICEIGFNAGHSTILMLLGREKSPLNYTIFDIGHHAYTRPCFNYVERQFQNINFEYIEGDSTLTMPEWLEKNKHLKGSYDLIHVDGGHDEVCIQNDMKNTDILIKVNGIVIIDDTYWPPIHACVEQYLASGNYKEISALETLTYQHRILQKIK